MDYEAVSRQLLRVLRGRRSQPAFSRRLGYHANVAYTWESGRRWPTAAIFFRAASRVGIDVVDAMVRFVPSCASWVNPKTVADPATVARLLSELRARVPIVDLAKRCKRSRYAVARWLSGAAEPKLPDFLLLVDVLSLRLLDFLALFVDPSTLPATKKGWESLEARRRAVYELPWLGAVQCALELRSYCAANEVPPGWIAARLGIPAAEEKRCIEALARSGQIRRKGNRWTPGPTLTVDTRVDPAAERRLKVWWAEVGVERLRRGSAGLFSFNVFSISASDLERLRELHRSYFRTMRSIIAESTAGDHVAVANLQMFTLDEHLEPLSAR